MKKITLLVALAITTSTIFAQNGNSYLMMNFGLNQNIRNFREPFYFNPIDLKKGGTPIGIQWIKATKNNSALRLGLEIYKKPIYNFDSYSNSNDTSFYKYSTSNIIIPRLTIGKEFRKQIHKDVMLYAGSDFGIGMMSNLFVNYSQISTSTDYVGTSGGGRPRLDLSLSARPFLGIRTDWNRFVIGYEASLPINYTQVLGQDIRKVDGFKLQHQISVGYKLGKKK